MENMEIKPTYITFEQAKLLKEKNFNLEIKSYYRSTGSGVFETKEYHNWNDDATHETVGGMTYVSAPEQWQVVEWLRVNYNINITYTIDVIGSDEWCYGYHIWYIPEEFDSVKRRCSHILQIYSFKEGYGSYTGGWNSPQEAYSAAFDYCLKELI